MARKSVMTRVVERAVDDWRRGSTLVSRFECVFHERGCPLLGPVPRARVAERGPSAARRTRPVRPFVRIAPSPIPKTI